MKILDLFIACFPLFGFLWILTFAFMQVLFRRFTKKHPFLTFFMSAFLFPVLFFIFLGLDFILRVPLYAYPNLWLALRPIKINNSMQFQPGLNEIIPEKPLPAYGVHPDYSPVAGEVSTLYLEDVASCNDKFGKFLFRKICFNNDEDIDIQVFIYNDKGERYELCVWSVDESINNSLGSVSF